MFDISCISGRIEYFCSCWPCLPVLAVESSVHCFLVLRHAAFVNPKEIVSCYVERLIHLRIQQVSVNDRQRAMIQSFIRILIPGRTYAR